MTLQEQLRTATDRTDEETSQFHRLVADHLDAWEEDLDRLRKALTQTIEVLEALESREVEYAVAVALKGLLAVVRNALAGGGK